ncbi:MAG: hypothetical protein JNJ54_08360 [Myxococcaceae bacterium]|nr:hypothetical protein [Myxococcaceae bacterium]
MTRAARLLAFTWLLLLAGPTLLAALLLAVAATWRGQIFALTALCFVAVPILGLRRLAVRTRARLAQLAVTSAAGALGLVTLVLATPRPRHGLEEGAWAVSPQAPGRFALTTLLPEVDQLVLGSHLIAAVDPYITLESSRRIRRLFLSVYQPMLEDPRFAALPTQMGEAWADEATGQRFVYVPPHAPGEQLPCVVFLHGSGGNFQGYLWVWKSLADAGRFVVVAPGFGFGNWHRAGGVEAIEAARRFAIGSLPVDPQRLVLAGLSNGGRGVMRAIEADQARAWSAVVLISAVVDVDPTPEAWRGRPVLLVHGLKDDRIAAKWFSLATDALRGAGASVTPCFDAEEDHFLFFSRPDQVQSWVLGFLHSEVGLAPPAPDQVVSPEVR